MSSQTQTMPPRAAADHADPNGSYHWQTASGALGSLPPATAPGGGGWTHQLRLTDFGFSVPTGATVKGVKLELKRSASQNDGDYYVMDAGSVATRVLKGGTVSPLRPATYSHWATSPEWATYGGPTDLWGVSLTPADVNDPAFGFAVGCDQESPEGQYGNAKVYEAKVTVYYEAP